ncbi:MAG: hypothetical protein MR210_05750 [Erysipelotrichaceae bacterium]|nr:hypothetical protein [Erysipelotrichaceae bacterium]MDY5252674.1 hypothetical protein [Erysipelotrichaceae bacterium]
MSDKYQDIIEMAYPFPNDRYPNFPMEDRCAQFMPFAALKGHSASLKAKNMQKTPKKCLSEDEKNQLDRVLSCLNKGDQIKLTYHDGIKIIRIMTFFKKIDEYANNLVTMDHRYFLLKDIYELEIVTKREVEHG